MTARIRVIVSCVAAGSFVCPQGGIHAMEITRAMAAGRGGDWE